MKFGLKGVKGTAVNHLKAWGIYDVVLRSVEYVHGKSAKGNDWKGMAVTFAGEQGVFTKTFFCPMTNAEERKTGEKDGRKWELPSPAEQLGCTLAHLGEALSPEKYKKFQGMEFELPEDFEKLVESFAEVLKPAINKSTQLKLVANKQNFADIPNFISINKSGDAIISNNWVGKNVAFTDKELINKEKKASEKPTQMKDSLGVDSSNDDINLDDLNRDI